VAVQIRSLKRSVWVRAVVLFVLYYAGAVLGDALSVQDIFPTFWPPAGIMLAALLLTEPVQWPVLLTAGVSAGVAFGVGRDFGLPFVVASFVANIVEPIVGAALIRRFVGPKPGLQTVRQVAVFVGAGALLAPAIGTLAGVYADVAFSVGAPEWRLWVMWWISCVSGVIIVASPALAFRAWWVDFAAMDGLKRGDQLRMLVASAGITGVSMIISWQVFTAHSGISSFKFLLFPGILAADAVGGPFAAAIFLFAVAFTGIAGMALYAPPAEIVSAAEAITVLQAQGFFVTAGVTSLALSAALLHNRRLAAAAIADKDRMEHMVQEIVGVMGAMVEMRDPYTRGHEEGTARIARMIAEEMGLSDEDCLGIEMAGRVHDIGKLGLPAEILTKPGRLSEIEFQLIKTHPDAGCEILKSIDFGWPIAETVHQHHERMNGSGYPQGLVGEEILRSARVLAVADVVDAMAADRPYRPALGLDVAVAEIREHPELFDAEAREACLALYDSGRLTSV
jgi:integral membrane sensor domain MASE1